MSSREIKIAVIVQDIENIENALEFIRTKGWDIAAFQDIDEAVKYIAQENIPFVMVSYDHENDRTKEIAPILSRSFGTQVIAFCERKTKMSSRILGQSGQRYLLFPPIRGEAIYDKILKMVVDQKRQKHIEPIVEKPKKISPPPKNLFDEEPKPPSFGFSEPKGDSGKLMHFSGPDAKAGHVNYQDNPDTQAKSRHYSETPDKEQEQKSQEPEEQPKEETSKNQRSDFERSEPKTKKDNSDNRDFFKKIVEPAFRRYFGKDALVMQRMEPVVILLNAIGVKTKDFSGFLVFDLTMPEFLREKRLLEFAKEIKLRTANLGLSITLTEPIRIELDKTERRIFIEASNKFLMGDDNSNLAMLFAFDDERSIPKVQYSQDSKTCMVDHEDIISEIPLDFSVYIHLPRNKKYYLFVRRGRKFTAKRVNRLKRMEHELFIYRKEEFEFNRYFVKARLLEQILKPYLERSHLGKTGS